MPGIHWSMATTLPNRNFLTRLSIVAKSRFFSTGKPFTVKKERGGASTIFTPMATSKTSLFSRPPGPADGVKKQPVFGAENRLLFDPVSGTGGPGEQARFGRGHRRKDS